MDKEESVAGLVFLPHYIIQQERMGTAMNELCRDNQIIQPGEDHLLQLFWQKVHTTTNILASSLSLSQLQQLQLKFGQTCQKATARVNLQLPSPPNSLLFCRFGRFIYGGQIQNQYFEGRGIIVYANGSAYAGELKAGRYDGKGEFRFRREVNLRTTEVIIQTDRSQNSIVATVETGTTSQLRFKITQNQLKKNKHKYVRFKNGSQYVGQWSEGYPHGKGKYVYSNTSYPYYEGHFARGQRHGSGTLHYDGSKRLRIRWSRDRPYGEGELSINDYSEQVVYSSGERVYKRESQLQPQ